MQTLEVDLNLKPGLIFCFDEFLQRQFFVRIKASERRKAMSQITQ